MGRVRSNISPLTLAASAASARRAPMPLAMSMGRVSAATDCLLPSGRVISMWLIGNFQRSTRGHARAGLVGYHQKTKVRHGSYHLGRNRRIRSGCAVARRRYHSLRRTATALKGGGVFLGGGGA